jgi:uncharacterized protein YggE
MRFPNLPVALALIALAVAIGALVAIAARPQTIAAATTEVPARHITVVGHGQANATPDTASIQMGVQSEAATAREALTDNNTKMAALIAKLKELGVADKDIQTSNINIYPRYDNEGRDVLGYQVSNTVTVKIRNVNAAGALLDQVVDAGANNMSGISFMVDDAKALEQQAREQAIAGARSRAEAMAQAAGSSVGQVISITENIGSTPPIAFARQEAKAMAADAMVAVQPGEQTIMAQVQMTYELR